MARAATAGSGVWQPSNVESGLQGLSLLRVCAALLAQSQQPGQCGHAEPAPDSCVQAGGTKQQGVRVMITAPPLASSLRRPYDMVTHSAHGAAGVPGVIAGPAAGRVVQRSACAAMPGRQMVGGCPAPPRLSVRVCLAVQLNRA